jgi:hypothetical protein
MFVTGIQLTIGCSWSFVEEDTFEGFFSGQVASIID